MNKSRNIQRTYEEYASTNAIKKHMYPGKNTALPQVTGNALTCPKHLTISDG